MHLCNDVMWCDVMECNAMYCNVTSCVVLCCLVWYCIYICMSTLNGACDPPKQLQPLRLRTAICDVPLGGLRAADEARKRGPVPQMWLSSWENGGKSKKIWQNEIFNLGLVAFFGYFRARPMGRPMSTQNQMLSQMCRLCRKQPTRCQAGWACSCAELGSCLTACGFRHHQVEKPGLFAAPAQQALTTRCWLSEEKKRKCCHAAWTFAWHWAASHLVKAVRYLWALVKNI
jgi:hypothetical protein